MIRSTLLMILALTLSQNAMADAGPNQTVDEGALVTLSGSGSTPAFTNFSWSQITGPTVTLSSSVVASPTFTAPEVTTAGDTLSFLLTVDDGAGNSENGSVTITVANVNDPPVANAGPDQTVEEGAQVTLDGSGSSDPDPGDTFTFSWVQTGGAAASLSATDIASPTFTAPNVPAGGDTLTFQLTVEDEAGATNSNTVNITVTNTNQPPVADAGSPQTAAEGTTVTLNGSGSTDENTSTLSYSWIQLSGPPAFTSRTTVTPSFLAPQVGFDGPTEVTAQLTVTDEGGLTSTDTVVITITNTNIAPTADAGSDQTVSEDTLVNLDGTASSDPDTAIDDILTFAWTQTGGTSVTLTGENTATPSFQSPVVGAAGGSAAFTLTVTDRGGEQSSDSVTINFTDSNVSPTADAGPDQTVNEGVTVNLTGTASTDDAPTSELTYSWVQSGGPAVTLTGPDTVTPSFTAPQVGFDDPNAITLTLTVTDIAGLTGTDTVIVNVTNVNLAPTANAGAEQTVEEGGTVNLDGSGSTDPDIAQDDELSFAWTQTAGVAVTLIGDTTATPSFQAPDVPAGGGSATLTLTVTDRGALQDSATVVVNFTDSNVAPVANAGADQTIDEGATVSLNGAGSTDESAEPLQFAWTQSSGPVVTLSDPAIANPTFVAPDVGFDPPNTVVLLLTVTDEGGLTDTDTVTITANNLNAAPTANAGTDQTVGEQVLVTLDGSGSTDPDLSVDDALTFAWTQDSGDPVTLTGPDTANPTFTSPNAPAGGSSATFTLTVTDRGSLQSSDSVIINFTDGNTSPVADAGVDQTVDEATLVTLTGAGSTDEVVETLEYAWDQTSGTPVPLTGADTINPTFTAPDVGFDTNNTLVFILTVTDEEGLTGTDTVTLVVTNVNQPPVADAGGDQVVSENSPVTLDGSGSTDPDLAVDDVLTFAWTQTNGAAVTLTGADTATPSFQAPNVDDAGESATFTLTVTDRGDLESTDTVVVSFSDQPNQPPTVNAGASVEVVEASAVTLDGSNSSDADGTIESFQWTQIDGPQVELQQADQAQASFTAPEVPVTGATLTFQLEVTDDEDSSATAVVNIFVRDTTGVMAPVAAVLPSSRSALVNSEVGAFATIINPSDIPLTSCTISPTTDVPIDFSFFETDPADNGIVGEENAPIDIAANGFQTFVMFFTPTAAFEPTDVEFAFECSNSASTQTLQDVNTLLLSAADTQTADIVALVASISQDGVARIPGPDGVQAFGVAIANVGAGAEIVASTETSIPGLNITLSICETDPDTGACLAPPATVTEATVSAGDFGTYSVFVSATGDVPFDPATNRIRVLFSENGVIRGSTSIAVTTN